MFSKTLLNILLIIPTTIFFSNTKHTSFGEFEYKKHTTSFVCALFPLTVTNYRNSKSKSSTNSNIIGKWKIKKVKFPEKYFDASNSKNIMFFGSQLWANAEGKFFHFKKGTIVLTNIFLHENEPLKLLYKWEAQNEIRIYLDESDVDKSFKINTNIKTDEMIWTIDNILEVSLIRDFN